MVFLVDNGSVRPASYLNLKRIAGELSQRIGQAVTAAPLLHANKIPPDKVGGEKVEILENLLRKAYLGGDREWSLLPLFFGPSGAILDYLPRRLRLLAKTHPGFFCKLSHPLYRSDSNGGPELIQILGELTESVMEEHRLQKPTLILVDHGSPRREVTFVRNVLAKGLARALEGRVRVTIAASLERRKGPNWDFNEPLLERALAKESVRRGDVVIAQMFISPGRHAGPGGDIPRICAEAERRHEGLKTYRTRLVGEHPKLIELLETRWRESAFAIDIKW